MHPVASVSNVAPPPGRSLPGSARFQACAMLLILAFGLLLYGHTLLFPFVFDDYIYLVDNPLMKDWRSFVWRGDFAAFANYSKNLGLDPDLSTNLILRPVTYFTFYLNYLLDGMQPRGFRAVNIAIHCANALLLFGLVSRLLRTSRKNGALPARSADFIGLSAALLFLVHPLQIESVTYVVQRFTSLATLFYLLTVLTFLRANNAADRRVARRWRIFSVASLVVGMFTKEFLFTAPVMLLCLDWLVMGTPFKTAFRRILPYGLSLPLIPILIFLIATAQNAGHASLSATLNITKGAGHESYYYALTQLSVVLTYLRLILLPRGLNLDWDFPLTTSLLHGPALGSALLIAALLGGAACWYRRWGHDVRHALLCCGVLWFFVTVAIDSSIVPLPDLMCEHRSYLPSVGILCALACGADLLRTAYCQQSLCRYALLALMGAGILALATATNLRHQVWHSEIDIWKDTASKSPQKFRPWFNLGPAYFEKGRLQEAATCTRKAIQLQPTQAVAYRNLGCVENALGRHREALEALRVGARLAPNDYALQFELGKAYACLGDLQQGEVAFKTALSLRPSHRPAHLAMVSVCYKLQRFDQALEHMRKADELQPLEPPERQLAIHIAQLVQQAGGRLP